MHTNLKSLFVGKREIVEVAPKRGLGRPRKSREQADEEPDVVLVAVEIQANQLEAYEVDLALAPQKCRRWRRAASLQAICEAAGKSLAELRMPGSSQRKNKHVPRGSWPCAYGCRNSMRIVVALMRLGSWWWGPWRENGVSLGPMS